MGEAIEMLFKASVWLYLYYRILRFAFLIGAEEHPWQMTKKDRKP